MEFRLNKIDMEIRQDINDETSEGKIHKIKGIKISKDKSEEKHRERQNLKDKEKLKPSKYVLSNEKITIEAYKSEELEVQGEQEVTDGRQTNKGLIIDVRK